MSEQCGRAKGLAYVCIVGYSGPQCSPYTSQITPQPTYNVFLFPFSVCLSFSTFPPFLRLNLVSTIQTVFLFALNFLFFGSTFYFFSAFLFVLSTFFRLFFLIFFTFFFYFFLSCNSFLLHFLFLFILFFILFFFMFILFLLEFYFSFLFCFLFLFFYFSFLCFYFFSVRFCSRFVPPKENKREKLRELEKQRKTTER